MYDVGTAAVQVIPTFVGFQRDVEREMTLAGTLGGKAYKRAFEDATRGMGTGGPGGGPGPASRSGAQQGSAFARAFRRAAETALRDLPEVTIDANSTQAQKDIAEIRAQLIALRDAKIGVDIDAAAAMNQLNFLREELERLGAETTDVSVKMDTALAAAQIARLQAQIAKLEAEDVDIDVDVDTSGAIAQLLALRAAIGLTGGGFSGLISIGILLAPALVPVIAAVTAAVVALGGAVVVAFGALGAVVLAVAPLIGAVMAIGKANDEAAKSAGKNTRSQRSVAGALDSVASAERSLANTRANAADQAAQAARTVKKAERDLADAQRAARTAQDALTQAREDAKRAMEDLNNEVKQGALDQRRASLTVEEAKRDLDRVLMDETANKFQRDMAQLTYDDAVARLEQVRQENARLAEEKLKADKAGVEGSKQVAKAQDGVREANQRVRDAQEGVAQAIRDQTAQQRQSAFAIVQAQQAVINAQRSLATSMQSTGATGGTAMEDLRKKMANLTPEGQRFANFLYGLKGTFTGLSKAAQKGLFPGLEAGIRAVTDNEKAMGTFERLVFNLSKAMGGLAKSAGEALASPRWGKFFDYLGSIAGPTMDNISAILGNLAQAFGNLLMAFTPTSKQMGDGLVGMTQAFADWSAGLKDNDGFQTFIGYVQKYGPMVVDFFFDFMHVIEKLGEFLAPLGAVILGGLAAAFDWLASLTPNQFAGVVYAISAIGVAILLLVGGPVTLFVAGITLMVAGLVYAYKKFTWFRTIVDVVFRAIAVAATWLWQNVLIPVFKALSWWVQNVVAPAFLWLYEHVIKPVWAGIQVAISWAWERVIKPVLAGLAWFLEHVLAPVFSWLYENVIKPVWAGIKIGAQVAWAVVKVIFGLMQIGVKVLGAVFSWLYRKAIKPVWDGISSAVSWVWEKVLKPVFTALGGFIEKYVAPAFSKGVEAIKKAWEKVQDIAKKPVGFVLKTVLENGLLKGYNWLADKFGVGPVHIPGDVLAKFAEGGPVRGGVPGKDSVPSLLMPNEHVLTTEEVRKAGGHDAVYRLRRAILAGQPIPQLAGGGNVGDWLSKQYHRARNTAGRFVSGVKDLAANPAGALKRILDKVLGLMPTKAQEFSKLAAAAGRKTLTGAVDSLKGIIGLGSPDGDVAKGSSPSTAALISAARASGVPFRVTSTFRPGSRSLSGGLDNHSLGQAVDFASSPANMEKLAAHFLKFTPYLKELIHSGGPGYFVKNGRRVGRGFYGREVANHYDHVHAAGTGESLARARKAYLFDNGGYLPPGLSTVYNGLRRPEPLGNLDKMSTAAGGGMTLRVKVDDGAVRGLVHVEVEDAFGSLADAKVYGTT